MAEGEGEVLDYAAAKAALDRLVGQRVTARIITTAGDEVAEIAVGYLQPASQFGAYPRDDEVTVYRITEQAEPGRGYHHPFWPSISIHDVRDFTAWTNGASVDCRFRGVLVTVTLAISDEWLAGERAYGADR